MSYAQYPGATFFGVRKIGIFNTVSASNLITPNLEQAPVPAISFTGYINPAVVTIIGSGKFATLCYDVAGTQPITVPGNLIVRSVNVNGNTTNSPSIINSTAPYISTTGSIGGAGVTDIADGANFTDFTASTSLIIKGQTISENYLGIGSASGLTLTPSTTSVTVSFF